MSPVTCCNPARSSITTGCALTSNALSAGGCCGCAFSYLKENLKPRSSPPAAVPASLDESLRVRPEKIAAETLLIIQPDKLQFKAALLLKRREIAPIVFGRV